MSRVDPTQRTSRQASAQGVESAHPVEVLDPSDLRGQNIRYATDNVDPNYNRRTAQNFSRTTNTNNQAQTNSNQDPNEPSGKNAFENIIGRGRTAVDKAGTTLMWGAGGLAGLLYLGLGWKKLAMVIGGLGVGAGYLLKTKLAKVGEEPDHNQRIVNEVKAMKLPKELEKEIFEFLNQRLTADAYKNSNGQNLSATARDILRNASQQAVNTAQQAASSVNSRFGNQPSSQQPT
ncbi:MAG: hypothetical protein KGO93_08910 [Cyanobacteria bacterium REEB446]|nr:hypothetical protein [Cyanobacteria bacterium REEB446]